jgi:hypothetical protein
MVRLLTPLSEEHQVVHILRPLAYLAAIVAVAFHLFLSFVLPNLNINA